MSALPALSIFFIFSTTISSLIHCIPTTSHVLKNWLSEIRIWITPFSFSFFNKLSWDATSDMYQYNFHKRKVSTQSKFQNKNIILPIIFLCNRLLPWSLLAFPLHPSDLVILYTRSSSSLLQYFYLLIVSPLPLSIPILISPCSAVATCFAIKSNLMK